MIEITWKKLPRSERAKVGHIEADVWAIGGNNYAYSVLDTNSGYYLGGGRCNSIDEAKEQIDQYI